MGHPDVILGASGVFFKPSWSHLAVLSLYLTTGIHVFVNHPVAEPFSNASWPWRQLDVTAIQDAERVAQFSDVDVGVQLANRRPISLAAGRHAQWQVL